VDEFPSDPFHVIFPTDEMIMSFMEDTPWDDGNHHSILFLEQHTLENYQRILTPSTIVVISIIPQSCNTRPPDAKQLTIYSNTYTLTTLFLALFH
jgi:hypothetical protein